MGVAAGRVDARKRDLTGADLGRPAVEGVVSPHVRPETEGVRFVVLDHNPGVLLNAPNIVACGGAEGGRGEARASEPNGSPAAGQAGTDRATLEHQKDAGAGLNNAGKRVQNDQRIEILTEPERGGEWHTTIQNVHPSVLCGDVDAITQTVVCRWHEQDRRGGIGSNLAPGKN